MTDTALDTYKENNKRSSWVIITGVGTMAAYQLYWANIIFDQPNEWIMAGFFIVVLAFTAYTLLVNEPKKLDAVGGVSAFKVETDDDVKERILEEFFRLKIEHNLYGLRSDPFSRFLKQAGRDITRNEREKASAERDALKAKIENLTTSSETQKEAYEQRISEMAASLEGSQADTVTAKATAIANLTNVELLSEVLSRSDKTQWSDGDAEKMTTALLEQSPDIKERVKALAYVTAEAKRIDQYESILNLYTKKISNIRAQEMDPEDQEEAIMAMKRLRDREIDLLEKS